jgi:nucleotide-binding universal stress UspA family protein
MFERVLVPTDGGDGAGRALDLAIDIARTYGATLYVVYVVDLHRLPIDEDSDTWLIHQALESEGESTTAALKERTERPGVERVETAVLEGTPHRAILDYVRDHDIDLVVMRTHGRRGLSHFLLGSVTERVIRTASVPVLTVRVADDPIEEASQ